MEFAFGISLVHPTDPILGRDMLKSEQIKAVAKILKKRFPNLTVEETIDLSVEIAEALSA